MHYVLAASHELASILPTNQLILLVSSSVAGIVAILTAGRKS
jgi:hypothetical protein